MTIGFTAMNAEDISAARRQLAESTGMSVDELRDRSRSFSLSPREQGVLDQIDDLADVG